MEHEAQAWCWIFGWMSNMFPLISWRPTNGSTSFVWCPGMFWFFMIFTGVIVTKLDQNRYHSLWNGSYGITMVIGILIWSFPVHPFLPRNVAMKPRAQPKISGIWGPWILRTICGAGRSYKCSPTGPLAFIAAPLPKFSCLLLPHTARVRLTYAALRLMWTIIMHLIWQHPRALCLLVGAELLKWHLIL